MPTYDETKAYLYALKNRGSKFGIDRMVRLVEALGHPERKFPVIHVAGTNGKGSVCAMLEALYRLNGYRTGLFTSPHLVHLGERAQVNRRILTESGIVDYVAQLRPIAAGLGREDPDLHPTFFEFVAAMAFLRFASEEVDIALIETGLGGRLDATNVVDPELSIITSISFDHMELLGDTLAKIAGEKAGIIKPGKPVLMGCLPDEAEAVIRATAAERGCPLYSVRERFDEAGLPVTNLSGDFQRWNAAIAVYATEILKERFPGRSAEIHESGSSMRSRSASFFALRATQDRSASAPEIRPPADSPATGITFSHEALMQIDWPGRWQKIEFDGRTLILDATHNPEGAKALTGNLRQLVERGIKPIIVAGTLGEDRGRSLMEAVAPYARELYLVEPKQDRATPTAFLESCLPTVHGFPVKHSNLDELFPAACVEAPLGRPGDIIVVTGSIYLIGEVLERIQGGSGGRDLQDKF